MTVAWSVVPLAAPAGTSTLTQTSVVPPGVTPGVVPNGVVQVVSRTEVGNALPDTATW